MLLFSLIGSVAKAHTEIRHVKKDSSFMAPNVKVQDNPIAAMLDSLSSLQFFEKSNKLSDLNNTNNFAKDFVPNYSDDVYRDRFSQFQKTSPIPMVYNSQVKDMIDLYTIKKRTSTEYMLGLAQLYFPMIEELLDRYGIPLEMKYLAIVESALNPIAKSHVGAGGLWQFMYGTGKQYSLDVNSYVDDRNDPYDATIAACKYLKDLYKIHKDWLLVMAAYNCGTNNVTKAIRRSGGKTNFWEISPYLPKETQAYIPAFTAVAYVMNHASDHNLIPIVPMYKYNEIDTVLVKDFLTFDELSKKLNVSKNELVFLNPAFRKGVIPSSSEKSYALRLPKRCIPDFINNETALYAYNEMKGKINFEKPLAKNGKESYTKEGNQYHKVKVGESLALLSKKYNATIAQLKEWNNLNKKGSILLGQQLIVNRLVKTQNETILASKNESGNQDSQNQTLAKYITYKVQPGDTLLGIANKNETSIYEIKKWNNFKSEDVVPGQQIKIKITS
jgi:membrane-bound lytic murein transglycosylase D